MAGPQAVAATATWTNTIAGASDFWTNNVNWTAAHPSALADNAFLTNSTATTYTNILDAAITVGRVVISNANASGQAWLVVTNGALSVTNVALGIAGRLRIDDGGIVSNVTSLTMAGNNGLLQINAGGMLMLTGGVSAILVGTNSTGNRFEIIGDGTARSALATNVGSVSLGGVGGSANLLILTNGGALLTGASTVGLNSSLNVGTITSEGSVWDARAGRVTVGFAVSDGIFATNNTLHITSGGMATNLVVWVGLRNAISSGANSNSLIVSNGGKLYSGAALQPFGDSIVGYQSMSNSATVTGDGSVWDMGGRLLTIGIGRFNFAHSSNNTVTVTDGGLLNNAAIHIGSASNQAQVGMNRLIVTNRGTVVASSVLVGGFYTVGSAANGNSVLVLDNSVLEANVLSNFTGGVGNTISNRNATYQFTTASPTIFNNGAANIAITDGTISFRAISNADITNNLGNGALSGIRFAGANTFMLNAASNTTAGQAYTFAVTASPSNYVNLAMVNGHTAYRGGNLNIGATGGMLVSNTTATIGNQLIADGTVRTVSSTLRLNDGLTGSGVVTNAGANSTLVFDGGAATFGGTLRGAGLAVTMSSGEQTLTGNHSYGGATTVSGGTLTLANTSGTALSLSAITVNGGQLRVANTGGAAVGAGNTVTVSSGGSLTGNGTLAGAIIVNNNGTISPGSNLALGTLTTGALTLNAGSRLDFQFSGGNNDFLAVTDTGGLSIDGGVFRLLQGDGVTPFDAANLYYLMNYTGAIGGTGVGALSVGNPTANRTYNFGTSGGYVTLAIGGTGIGWNPGMLSADAYWMTAANWNGGSGPAPVEFDQLVFDGNTKVAATNNFASGTRFSGIVFTNTAGSFVLQSLSSGSNIVNLVGNVVNRSANTQTINVPLTLEGGSRTFNASNGALVINGVIRGADSSVGLIKQGNHLVTLTGANTYSGITEIVTGTLRATHGAGLPAASNLKFSGGVLESSGTLSRSVGTAGGSVQWAGAGGFSAYGGTLSVNLGASVTWPSNVLIFSSSTANSTVNFISGLDLNGSMRTVQVVNGTAIVDADITGAITGGAGSGLTKSGDGTLRLSGNNSYSGPVLVNAGTLVMNAPLAAGSPLTLAGGAWLGGTGTVGRVVTGSGGIAPGNSPGILTVDQLNPSANMNFSFEFTNIGSPDYTQPGASLNDVLRITNALPFTVALGLTNTVHLYIQTPLTLGVTNVFRGGFYTDVSASFDGSITGATFVVHGPGTLLYVTTTNEPAFSQNGYVMEFGVFGVAAVVPEPSVLLLLIGGLATLYFSRRRMKRQ
ncbi:MAG: hypothetical protein PCFJNLEI_01345 [Verrucomicrobiae bacterium]|nr:hypothetical protein [Verrucomicrobiae bacterium]